jgi:hypothetical protein
MLICDVHPSQNEMGPFFGCCLVASRLATLVYEFGSKGFEEDTDHFRFYRIVAPPTLRNGASV